MNFRRISMQFDDELADQKQTKNLKKKENFIKN